MIAVRGAAVPAADASSVDLVSRGSGSSGSLWSTGSMSSCNPYPLPSTGELVEHLHTGRKPDRRVDVALGHMHAEAVGDQCHADQQQEREHQHLYRRMAFRV